MIKNFRAKWLLLIAAGLTAGFYFYPHQAPETGGKSVQPRPVQSPKSTRAPQTAKPTTPEQVVELLEKGAKFIPTEKLRDFLSSNSTRAAAWGAVFDLSGDQTILREALSKFPGDHRLLLRAINSLDPPREREPYIREFTQKYPDESIGDYANAFIRFQAGDEQGAVDLLRTAIGKKPPVVFDNEDVLNRKAALETMDLTEFEATYQTFNAPIDRDRKNGLREILPNLLSSEAPEEVKQELGLAYCVHIRQTQSKSSIVAHQALAFEAAFLANLPPESEYGNTGKTIGERLQTVRVESDQAWADATQVKELWLTATPQEIRTFADSALAGGEQFAYRRWVEARAQALQKR